MYLCSYQTLLLNVDAVVEPVVLPSEEGGERDDDRGEPDEQDHGAHRAEGARVDVLHLGHSPIPARRTILEYIFSTMAIS